MRVLRRRCGRVGCEDDRKSINHKLFGMSAQRIGDGSKDDWGEITHTRQIGKEAFREGESGRGIGKGTAKPR